MAEMLVAAIGIAGITMVIWYGRRLVKEGADDG